MIERLLQKNTDSGLNSMILNAKDFEKQFTEAAIRRAVSVQCYKLVIAQQAREIVARRTTDRFNLALAGWRAANESKL
jgi:hypothetical protein